MIDYFALLQQPRRPWLDPEQLKQKRQQLTLAAHPDRQGSNRPALNFAAINEAYRVLSDPKLRLRHLLSLEDRNPVATQSIPPELTELFTKTGTAIQEVDRLVERLRGANSVLSKSLLRSEVLEAQKRSNELLDELQNLFVNTLDALKQLDATWNDGREDATEDLAKLYRRFSYLGRWMDQIRERQFQLSI
jgi:curved DNA-binding protein CbpA